MKHEDAIDSYYRASVSDGPVRPALAESLQADVCVIGAGYSGLSTAIELAERGLDVVVLEAQTVGWGASGRNGGQVCSGFSSGTGKIERALGREDARLLFDMAEESKEIIRHRVETHQIACDLKWGYYLAAERPRELREVEAWQEDWARNYDYDKLQVVRGAEASRQHVDSPRYIGGLQDDGAGHLHPLAYCQGLARAAEQAGVRIFEHSRVSAIERGAKPVTKTEAGAQVQASFLVVACNAHLGKLVPELARTIMPVGTYMAATHPLGERAAALIPQDEAIADLKFVLNYFRLSSDRRLLFGGRVSYSTLMPPNLSRAMRRSMLSVFPQLEDVSFEYVWGGYVAITMDRAPHLGRLDETLYFTQGYSGQGVSLSAIAGRVLAEAIAGQAGRFDVFARLPHQPFPGGTYLRTPTLALAMMWYRLRDLMP
ncbi:NAD(P)/FAD-dependent oxidoreductase [Fodinicurvata sediminis]|uniref:NAD(P)/FAD-dependent oxidoreductase n=1 Tax=Fodinicurvata sediminis TaxID=1121832 RepID=UPI0003B49B5B|nr:FAD-binding oxidoreductase [Fodinicurvata sediminis]